MWVVEAEFLGAIEKVRILQVHHLYYDLSIWPWEYPRNAVTTLCSWCHEEVHKTSKPPVYKRIDSQYVAAPVNWCNECHGSGIKPRYWYRDNGICYGCSGRGFII